MKKFLTVIGVVFGLALLLALGVSVTRASPATYCVRKSGNDGDTGACPGNAWLTVDHAANQVVAGDIVYIGSGIYRELVTMDTSGTVTDTISFIGDIDGAQTGDPGLVIISAFNSDTDAPVRANCLVMDDKEFITWQRVIFDGGTGVVINMQATSAAMYEGIEFIECVFNTYITGGLSVRFNFKAAGTPATSGPLFSRCVSAGRMLLDFDENLTAEANAKIVIENCLFLGRGGDAAVDKANIGFRRGVNTTHMWGGADINNCTFVSGYAGVDTYYVSATNKVDVRNCLFWGQKYGLYEEFTDALTSDYNRFHSVETPYTNVAAGANDDVTGSFFMLGGLHDMPFYQTQGWSPFRAWEPLRLQDDSYTCGLIGGGSAVYAPAKDLYDMFRPMGRSGTDDVGAVENRARGEKESTTFHGGALSLRFDGAGYHDAIIPVPAQAMTVTVYARYDGNHAGNLPQLKVYNIPGVADQTDTMVAAVNTWEQLEVNFTPTSAGYAIMRFVSRDTSANGECFFDDATY